MFVKGDIVKVRPEWLDEDEKKDPKYAEQEYFVRDCWDGKVEVVCAWDGFTGYLVYTWPDYTMYKVGHIDPAELNNFLNK